MSWLDNAFLAYRKVVSSVTGGSVKQRQVLRVLGATVIDNSNFVDPDTGAVVGSTDVTPAFFGDQGLIVAPPLASTWTHRNFGAGTTIVDSGRVGVFPTVYLSDLTTGTAVVRGADQVIAAAPYTVIARFRLQPINNAGAGMYLTDGTKVIAYMFDSQGGVGQQQVFTGTTFSSGFTVVSGGGVVTPADLAINQSIYYAIKDDNTNRHYQLSVDGQHFVDFFTHASGTFLTATNIGFFGYGTSGTGWAATLESWQPTTP